MQVGVIPGRDCGTCTVCCVELTIDDPELQKVQGYRCKNLVASGGCGIYATRPGTCRRYECGWRLLKWVRAELRPDRSGVLIGLQQSDNELGISVNLLTNAALRAEGLAETIAAAVSAGKPVTLHVQGAPGYTSAKARIDPALAHAVSTLDKPAMLEILRQARRQAQKEGQRGVSVPIKLTPRAAPEGS